MDVIPTRCKNTKTYIDATRIKLNDLKSLKINICSSSTSANVRPLAILTLFINGPWTTETVDKTNVQKTKKCMDTQPYQV